MTDSLVPVLLLLVVAAVLAGVLLLLSTYLGRPKRSTVDRTPYECGSKPFEPVESHRFSVKFYLVAMLFILFDIEAAFLYPWAVTFHEFTDARAFVLGELGVVFGLLVLDFAYRWW